MNNPFVDLRPLIFSEQCVIVSGAGTPEVNGTYLYAAQYNSRPVFYKDRYTIIYWDGSSWVIGANTDDKYFGTATTSPWQATWTRGEGQTPAPFVRQGTAHDFEREIGRRNDPTMRGTAAEKNVGTGPDDVAAGDHTHTASQVFTTGVLAQGIPALGGDRFFLPLILPTAPGQRTVYATPATDFVIWWNEAIEAWALSENRVLPYIDPESLITTSDEGDSTTPWEAAWGYNILPLPLGKLTDELLQTFATLSAVNSDKITFQTTLAQKADLIDGTVPSTQLPPISFQTTRYDGDGTTTAFQPPGVLTASDSPSAISVTVNGVTQEPGSDYTLNVATNRVVLTSALPLGDKIVITRALLLPSNSTLTAEQLGALTATSTIDGGSF